jgi:antitoxin ParD1/3/4
MTTNVHLTPALERFARKCVKSGRYNNVSEVVRSGLRMLQDAEKQREQFEASLREAEAEADREGTVSVDVVLADLDRIIANAKK